ncbi:hypothetical protein FACS1894189_7690 [Planctomycetales bacterium]|nr:hypothetical protein FACS1894189_7690 [Planctomycetales bacterium]
MALQERAFTTGNIVARFESLDYNTSPATITVAGATDLVLNAGDPVTATGIATSSTGLLGLNLEYRVIPAGASDDIEILDINYGFGVILNGSMLPATVNTAIKTALTSKGIKILT